MSDQLPDGTHLAYSINHESRWWRQIPTQARPNNGRPSIQVCASAEGNGGGVAWEFAVVEHDLGKTIPALKLGIFDDAWAAFADIPGFFASLADGDEMLTLDDVVAILKALGAVDETDRGEPR